MNEMKMFFGLTYLCKQAFSQLKVIKRRISTKMLTKQKGIQQRITIRILERDRCMFKLSENVNSQVTHQVLELTGPHPQKMSVI